jgi:hypothetical protein
VRIALAGRNHERLEEVRAGLPDAAAEWEIIVADASEPVTLAALAARTRVVATTVGPYVRLGMPLVEACAIAGTHYCDLTGEVLFVRQSADTWHETAGETGARIVHSCGFDSIPSDLLVRPTPWLAMGGRPRRCCRWYDARGERRHDRLDAPAGDPHAGRRCVRRSLPIRTAGRPGRRTALPWC